MNTKSRLFELARGLVKPAALIALLAVVATAGAGAMEHAGGAFAGHHGGPMTVEDMTAHVDKFLQHAYIEIEATPAQKAQLDPIVKEAANDLIPLHAQMHDFHDKVLAALTADTIDRAALENLRVDHVRAADEASRRITQLVGDVATVLTPAQRKTLAARIADHHGAHAKTQ